MKGMTARHIVDVQAEDEGLWFIAQYATEAYLQQALRRLHAAVEADTITIEELETTVVQRHAWANSLKTGVRGYPFSPDILRLLRDMDRLFARIAAAEADKAQAVVAEREICASIAQVSSKTAAARIRALSIPAPPTQEGGDATTS
jgi:hypothetical protein